MGHEIKVGTRVLNPGGYGVDGVVVAFSGGRALVAYDDGRVSEWIGAKHLTRKVGRPTGVATVPAAPRRVSIERRIVAVIQREMRAQHLTWDVLAKRASVSRATVARVLAGKADGLRLDVVEALAEALGVSPGEFWRVRD